MTEWNHRRTNLAGQFPKEIDVWETRVGDLSLVVDSPRDGLFLISVRNIRTGALYMADKADLNAAQTRAVEIANFPEMQTPKRNNSD